jgi:hypothetical protein
LLLGLAERESQGGPPAGAAAESGWHHDVDEDLATYSPRPFRISVLSLLFRMAEGRDGVGWEVFS